jgi:hypothetical protein
MPFPWRLLFFLLLLQVSVFEISAKPKKEASDPTPPAPISARVRGYSNEVLTIVLQARGRIEEPLQFLIRKNPAKGSLSEIRRTGPKTAEVDYRPAADAPTGEFYFTFAAQSVDSPVSAPVRVDIEINRRPAALEFNPQLDFGEVALGDSARVNLIISNTGGLPAILGIAPQPPWHLPEPAPDRVDAGKQVVITFIFEPQQTGAFSERLVITPDKSRFAVLRGTGKQSLSWPAQGLIIASEERKRSDLSIAFQNLTASTRSVEFQWPENLIGPKKLEIPALSTIPIPVSLAASAPPSFSFRGAVIFRSGNFSDSFPLTVHPAPPRLLITPENDLDLGETPVHETISGQFVVSNTGGLPAEVLMQVPEGLVVRPEPAGLLIDPSSSSEFEVSTSSAKPGDFSQTLMIGPSESQMQVLKIQYAVRPSQPVEKLLSIPAAIPNIIAQVKMPPVTGIRQISADKDSIELAWSVASPKLSRFQVERRVLGSDETEKWEAMPDVQYEILDQEARARVSKIRSGSLYILRIRGFDQDGNPTEASSKIRIVKPSPKSFSLPLWGWLLMLLALLAGAQWLLNKNANREHTNVES